MRLDGSLEIPRPYDHLFSNRFIDVFFIKCFILFCHETTVQNYFSVVLSTTHIHSPLCLTPRTRGRALAHCFTPSYLVCAASVTLSWSIYNIVTVTIRMRKKFFEKFKC